MKVVTKSACYIWAYGGSKRSIFEALKQDNKHVPARWLKMAFIQMMRAKSVPRKMKVNHGFQSETRTAIIKKYRSGNAVSVNAYCQQWPWVFS